MRPGLKVRPEHPDDVGPIGDVIRLAFEGKPYADGDEADLMEALRTHGALSVSLVAEFAGKIVGQAAFSPARASGGAPGWYGLGPVAVLPAHQSNGVGSTLIDTGLKAVSGLGASGCVLVGDPAYYSRFGFRLAPESAPPNVPSEFFMVKLLGGQLPGGSIHFHEAFGGSS